jgi:cation diffusion facilitator CzcD-associated flavoprotein CzcO/acetyl esterase/lipase
VTASWAARLTAFVVRHSVKPALGEMSDVARVRRVFAHWLPAPRGVRCTPATLGGVPGEWVEGAAGEAGCDTLLYLHGGGFVGCSPRTHRPLSAAFARAGFRVFVPDYRLAPEHPFPAAHDDALAAFRALRAELRVRGPGGRLVVAGDSAGGHLALTLMLALKGAGEPLPDAAALFSPATDLTGGSASITLNARRDAMFDGPSLGNLARAYLQGADPAQPLASPLLGELAGLPPLLVHVGADEALRDDGLRLAALAHAAGVTVELKVWPVVPHVWQLMRWLPQARRSVGAAAAFLHAARPREAPERVDVLIVGAGLSGIGAAVHLQRRCPEMTYAIVEARAALGGTWDLFRYPGVRSDSDMYTLGYAFKPWRQAQSIADGASIRRYIEETAAEHGIAPRIRYGQRVTAADWSDADACWTVHLARGDATEPLVVRAGFVLFCSGYYAYGRGHRPRFADEERFRGTIVHPQFWPEGLDPAGKRVVVIGSGATAMTLVPELAKTAAHVTMLQRSPTYVFARPSVDPIAEALKRRLPARLAYRLVRLKNVALQQYFYRLARRRPQQAKARMVALVRRSLPRGFDVARHFTPRYDVWDQRVCLLPDGDLYAALRDGRASVATDTIERFTESGLRLQSGDELPADVVVTATGLELNVLGDAALSIGGRPVDLSKALVYKGMMYGGVPNLANTFGYTNASWTLKADLTAEYVCRLLKHMDRHGRRVAMPVVDASVQPAPFIDFTSGYVQRALPRLPKQGDRRPWRLYQNYLLDLLTLRFGRIDDGVMAWR